MQTMDQYPDENEEFELQYQDELEMMNELEEQSGWWILFSNSIYFSFPQCTMESLNFQIMCRTTPFQMKL